MRLYSIYYICKKYKKEIKDMKIDSRTAGGNTIRSITGWKKKSMILNELACVTPLKENVRILYDTVPVVHRDMDQFDISDGVAKAFVSNRDKLLLSMETIIGLYECVKPKQDEETRVGFDVLLPQFENLSGFSECLKDLDFVLNQCPYLRNNNSQIKYSTVDIGSTWLTFVVLGAGAFTILKNLALLIDVAVKVKSHITTVKMQEEILRSMKLKDHIASEVYTAFEEANKVITADCINTLKQNIGDLTDAEEEDRLRRCVEKMAYWMEKGMQIYSAIDAPNEAKDLFPVQTNIDFLSDNIQKLIEMNQKEK